MQKKLKKLSAKEAVKAIRKAQQASQPVSENTPASSPQSIVTQTWVDAERDGRDAYANLKQLGSNKVPHGVEVVIAKRLHRELHAAFVQIKARGISKADFCSKIGLADSSESSKELNRLTVNPEATNKEISARRLRRHAIKYRYLIDGICKVTGQSHSTLADRVLMGTPLHPIEQFDRITQAENILNVLQGIVDKIDREFGLFAKFMEISELKAAHLASGGSESWPHLPYTFSDEMQEALKPGDPGFDKLVEAYRAAVRERSKTRAEHANPRHAFYPPDTNFFKADGEIRHFSEIWASLDSGPEFFHIPHAPLGLVIFGGDDFGDSPHEILGHWRSLEPESKESWAGLASSLHLEWDEQRKVPNVVSRQKHQDMMDLCWLTIYPRPDHARLMPMLYFVGEFSVLYPLDIRLLESLRQATWLDADRSSSAFDRLLALIGYRKGDARQIENDLRRTAAWLDHNPFFKMARAKAEADEQDAEMLRGYLEELKKDTAS